eukprot:4173757-Pyramimonas_sp.AAC.1
MHVGKRARADALTPCLVSLPLPMTYPFPSSPTSRLSPSRSHWRSRAFLRWGATKSALLETLMCM